MVGVRRAAYQHRCPNPEIDFVRYKGEDNAPSRADGGGRGPAAVRDMKARRSAGWTLDMLWERFERGEVEYDYDPGPPTG